MRFVALGHVTNDRLERGIAPGGSALYAGLAAAELGAETRVVTSCGPDFVGHELLTTAGVTVEVVTPAETTTCFENVYRAGKRHQRVLAVAAPLSAPVAEADVVFTCPVAGEVTPAALVAPPGAVLGAGLQGWLRAVDAEGRVSRRVPDDLSFLSPCHVLFASREDLGDEEARVLPALLPLAEIVVVTEGARGGRLYVRGEQTRYAAEKAREVDPTGAGDVFAAAFLLAVAARLPPAEAAALGARAAAVAVGGQGPAALPALARWRG